MRKHFLIFAFLITVISYGQNWNVFNKNYRYNYKFENSALISNVLFAETYSLAATDTVYSMNNIGVVTGSVLTINKSQFLMKSVIKQANGNVKLQDTTNITIIPTCTLNQSWLFDSNYNLTATCVSTSTQSIFNITDSIKTIVVNNVDSLILSKQFGIILFPKLYAQNKYYRLVGIENAGSYDSIPLFGTKVPNAWDFYKFNVGDKWCRSTNGYFKPNISYVPFCKTHTFTVNSKTITPLGYVYNVTEKVEYYSNILIPLMPCSAITPATNTGSYVMSFTNNSQTSLLENKMYPGMVTSPNYAFQANQFRFLSKLGKDNGGNIYKFYGLSGCGPLMNPVPAGPEYGQYPNSASSTTVHTTYPGYYDYADRWGTGLGMVNNIGIQFESREDFCLNCFERNSVLIIGAGFAEKRLDHEYLIYPNPAHGQINLPVDKGVVKLFDTFGRAVKNEILEGKSILDISNIPNGLYFVEIQTDSFKTTQKLIIQH